MRGSGLGDLFRGMKRDADRLKMGKIESYNQAFGIVLGDVPYVRPDGYTYRTYLDEDGRRVTYAPKKTVLNCPEPPKGHDATPRTKQGYQALRADCQKCPHHLPNMCCAILKKNAGNPHLDNLKMVMGAIREANEIVGGDR